jgi:hypothetical protein
MASVSVRGPSPLSAEENLVAEVLPFRFGCGIASIRWLPALIDFAAFVVPRTTAFKIPSRCLLLIRLVCNMGASLLRETSAA